MMTCHPFVWKRFLLDMGAAPTQSSSRYNFSRMSSLESERIVMRAISIDNWGSSKPRLYDCQKLKTHSKVYSSAILPGGKYLVVSMLGRNKRNCIAIYMLDRPAKDMIPLDMAYTTNKAFDLQAKYMAINGVEGIAVAYLTRETNVEPGDDTSVA